MSFHRHQNPPAHRSPPSPRTHPQTDRLDSVNHANAGRRPSLEQTPRENIFFFPYAFGFCPAPQTPRYHGRRRYVVGILICYELRKLCGSKTRLLIIIRTVFFVLSVSNVLKNSGEKNGINNNRHRNQKYRNSIKYQRCYSIYIEPFKMYGFTAYKLHTVTPNPCKYQ